MAGGVVVVGSVHMDLVATAERLPTRGETMPGRRFSMHPGGKGGNQAVQAALHGLPTALIGRVGRDDFGRQLLAALRAKGVDTAQVGVDEEAPTGASTVLVGEAGDYASIIVAGASNRLGLADIDAARSLLADARVLVAQLEIDPATTVHAVRLAKALGAMVVLNAAPVPPAATTLPMSLWRDTDVLVVNEIEAGMLLGGDGGPFVAEPGRVEALRRRLGVPTAIVTLGRRGSVLSDVRGERAVPGIAVPVADTIGAGDAFVGTLASRLAVGTELDAAVADANAAGALAVTKSGGYDALPNAVELRRFLEGRRDRPA